MYRLLILVAVLGLSSILTDAQAPTEPQKSLKEVVEQFYRLETEGRWLGPERRDELQDFLIEVGPWSAPESVSVLRSYRVVDCQMKHQCGKDQIEVDYSEWGSINSFLNFKRARDPEGKKPAAGEPFEQRTYQTLYLTDRFLKRSPSGDEQKTVPLRWRIALLPPPVVDVNSALRWVTELSDKINDPAIKYNAEKTTAILKGLSAGEPLPEHPEGMAKESPSEIAHRFVRLESALLPDQWNQLTSFFAETPKPQWDKVHIVDVVRMDIETNGTSSDVSISTNSLGELDSSVLLSNYPPMRLSRATPSASACYGEDYRGFNLLLSDKHWEIATNEAVKQFNGPLAWRIEDTFFEPLITLDTAIRYVRQVQDKTTDPVIKKHADRTLSILEYYKQGKPLPDEFSSGATGGCG